ncbi:hypothetical protein HDU93_003133 [Gonapodya sp. JEL0774]|nr:hypothetical protein HDU93_003133 [Gonapodya sp. JEL0774]
MSARSAVRMTDRGAAKQDRGVEIPTYVSTAVDSDVDEDPDADVSNGDVSVISPSALFKVLGDEFSSDLELALISTTTSEFTRESPDSSHATSKVGTILERPLELELSLKPGVLIPLWLL